MNIVDYVKKNKASFADSPLNEVDGLVFAELAYLNFGRRASGMPTKTLGEFSSKPDVLVEGTLSLLRKNNLRLLKAIAASPRFAPVEAGFFRVRNSDEKDVRFAAVTFRIGQGKYHVSFRGTGVSLVGWRENFKMALLSVIPTQRLALRYLVDVAARTEGDFTVGGLSKGGNLSVFSVTNAPAEVKSRIRSVFNYDGPGFKLSIFDDPRYIEISPRIHKLVPHDSIVGMLLTSSQVYDVVDSNGISVKQHDPFTWQVKDCENFKKLPQTTRRSQVTDAAVTEWLAGLDERTRRKFVYAVFSIVEGSGAKEVGDLLRKPLRKIRLMKKSYEQLDAPSKELISRGGKQLLSMWLGELFAFSKKKAEQ